MNVSADALRERFAVHGRFYEATLEGRSFALRSHLELFESHLGWREAVAADADLVAVMMNPSNAHAPKARASRAWKGNAEAQVESAPRRWNHGRNRTGQFNPQSRTAAPQARIRVRRC